MIVKVSGNKAVFSEIPELKRTPQVCQIAWTFDETLQQHPEVNEVHFDFSAVKEVDEFGLSLIGSLRLHLKRIHKGWRIDRASRVLKGRCRALDRNYILRAL